jgi:hypothetical protein
MDQRDDGTSIPSNFNSQDWDIRQVGNGFVMLPRAAPIAPNSQQTLPASSNPQRSNQDNRIPVNDPSYSNALTLHYAQQNGRKSDVSLQLVV